ncbi:MAG TPA: inositol monophosphatase family protein, partial [Mycobacteriales bacterium]|nr:inositol monophosphatase family protein [Mycobacteriales bacterium]
ATARIAAYVLFSVSPVHSAAGALLASEAGARVTDLDGNPWSVSSESLVAAADDDLHSEVLDLLDEAGGNGGRGRR